MNVRIVQGDMWKNGKLQKKGYKVLYQILTKKIKEEQVSERTN